MFERCLQSYNKTRQAMLLQVCKLKRANAATVSGATSVTEVRSAKKLPRISLPQFSGDYSSWQSFKDLFSSTIKDDNDIPAVEKMHYLRSSLTGEAGKLISNIPIAADSFKSVWDTLVARYENKRLLITSYMDQLFATQVLRSRSAQGLNSLLTSTTEALNALSALGIPIDKWDQVLVHHITKRLDSHTRE
ncbi:uncharacterized protein LOC127279886 [Leptopilina boulardi]|uniref:uncharacterized protein LOC127279886 n=1 Tax=Leptopilina boulardi TaxID=63433 RepID=UPI0021F61B75|nr:uncharacterized protein LOC127279886 [Leptopilina boulardi]